MAFNGGIDEFGVVALLQLPGTNHLSGKLVLSRSDQRADFFYNKGKLIHAALDNLTGKEVLLKVIDWRDGKFSFDSNASTDKISIKQDLQNTLMWALKERDELKKKKADEELAEKEKLEKLKADQQVVVQTKIVEQTVEIIPEPVIFEPHLFKDLSYVQNAYLLNSSGQIIANGTSEGNFRTSISSILAAIQKFTAHYPLKTFGKAFIEDSGYTIALSKLENNLIIVIVTPSNTRLGLLSIELNKFIRLLQSSGLDILNAKE